jgi:NAD(P)-dependent dehydrogenase (short-subunit alcohol dehydrogenase family)
VKADLAEIADCLDVVAAARSRFGRVDVLVNVAAVTDRGTIFDTTPEVDFDQSVVGAYESQPPHPAIPDDVY